jgi:prepilin-type N-terminal cleavage/methylation domain-containing protein/prepilin-type processing-associated H-X9-DG protein
MSESFITKKGFTLVELLVVISIIALLIVITLPAANKVQNSARRIACASNLKQIGLGMIAYLDDNNSVMPPAAMMPSVNKNLKSITYYVLPYLEKPEIFKCPPDHKFFEKEGTSYEYNMVLGGKKVKDSFFSDRLDMEERNIHVMYDFEPFHGDAGEPGAKNYLYADCHVGNLEVQ